MRSHRENPELQCWTNAQLVNHAVKGPALCAARMEALSSGGAAVDLTFVAGERVAVVPRVIVSREELEQRENSPFIWPQQVAEVLDEAEADRIESLLLPWVESLTLARPFTGEAIRLFGGTAEKTLFEAARVARFLGAARYEDVLSDAAPYKYAARFTDGRVATIRDARGSFGAVMLKRTAADVRANLQADDRNVLARRWYGTDLFGDAADRCDVSIAAASEHASAASVLISLDTKDGEHVVNAARPFAVACDVQRTLRSAGIANATAVGGSAGRILLLLRDDWRAHDDADSDEAVALAQMLQAEGFHADVRAASEAIDVRAYDLVHAFAAVNARQLRPTLSAAGAAGVPVVLTPALTDVCAEGAWGARIVSSAIDIAHDEAELGELLRMLELRRLEAPGISAKRQEPYPGYEQAVRQLLSAADAVIVSGPVEEAFLRSLGCSAPAVQGRPYVAIGDADPHAPRVIGTGPFVLIHAPVEPRNNQYLMLRAAALAGLPVLVAGPAADAGYYEALRRSSGERVVFVPDVSPRLAQALYRSARVYADLSWISYGTSRVAAAGAAGCALVVGRGSQGATLSGETAWVADPASVDSMAVALGDAWMHAAEPAGRIASGSARIAAWAEPGSALRATVQAYAAAQQSRVHA